MFGLVRSRPSTRGPDLPPTSAYALLVLGVVSGCGRMGFATVVHDEISDADAGDRTSGRAGETPEVDGGEGLDADPGGGGRDAGSDRLGGGARDGGTGGGDDPGFGVVFDFDNALAGWAPTDNDSPPGFREGRPDDNPGVFDEWWTPADGGDRELAIYRSSHTSQLAWGRSFRNDTGRRLVGVRVTYDLRIHYARFQGAEAAAPDFGLRQVRVAWALTSIREPDAVSPALTNASLGPELLSGWIDQAGAAGAGLVEENVVQELTGVDVAPGERLFLQWGPPFVGAPQTERHLSVGIDDLLVEAIPE